MKYLNQPKSLWLDDSDETVSDVHGQSRSTLGARKFVFRQLIWVLCPTKADDHLGVNQRCQNCAYLFEAKIEWTVSGTVE